MSLVTLPSFEGNRDTIGGKDNLFVDNLGAILAGRQTVDLDRPSSDIFQTLAVQVRSRQNGGIPNLAIKDNIKRPIGGSERKAVKRTGATSIHLQPLDRYVAFGHKRRPVRHGNMNDAPTAPPGATEMA